MSRCGPSAGTPRILYKWLMQKIAVFIFICILIASSNTACGQALPSCGSAGFSDPNEIAAVRKAPHGAKRIGKHTLEVNWAKGVQRFVDKGCTGVDIDGSCWQYCGYNSSLHIHQINHEEDDLFTGVLLDDDSGKILPAGRAVIFSPDGKKYFASSQEDGKEFADWKVYSRDGTLLWEGDSGTVDEHDQILAEFDDASWSSSGDLLTNSVDSVSGAKAALILMQGTDKKWNWVKRK